MKHDPPVPKNGRCAHCGKKRRTPPKGQRYATRAEFDVDPFCSTECARAWHAKPEPSAVVSVAPDVYEWLVA
jgi:hypothetical protein